MKTALKEAESDRRIYENAKEQNAEAMRRSGAEPVRGQADFWSQAFSPVSKSPIEVQTEALKATFNDSGVQKLLKDSLSSATIRSAVNSDADERTAGQKVLDTLTLGVSKDVRGILDRFSSGVRAQKAEEKAIQKDQGTIKREKKQVDQLSAQYRALKSKNTDGQNDEKMQRILAELQERTQIIKDAEKRIDERKADGVLVTVQHRPKSDDAVIFTFPFGEMPADEPMMRHALELSVAGIGTGGFFLGLHEGVFTLSAAIPLEGLDAEAFGRRMLDLAAATRRVALSVGTSVVDEYVEQIEAAERSSDACNQFSIRV